MNFAVNFNDALCCFIKLLYDALSFLHNFDALCYLCNPTGEHQQQSTKCPKR